MKLWKERMALNIEELKQKLSQVNIAKNGQEVPLTQPNIIQKLVWKKIIAEIQMLKTPKQSGASSQEEAQETFGNIVTQNLLVNEHFQEEQQEQQQ